MNTSISSYPPLALQLIASRCAAAAAAAVALLFASFLLLGPSGGQDELQFIHPVDEYVSILQQDPAARRFAIGVDNVFLILYSTLFIAMYGLLRRRAGTTTLMNVAFSLLGLLGFLDLLENMHFLVMLSAAENHLPLSAAQMELQVWESLVKFHVGYAGLFMLGWVFPKQTPLEKAVRFALLWVQLPVGLLIYLTPASIAFPLVVVRTTFFLFSLLALAWIVRQWQFDSNEPQ